MTPERRGQIQAHQKSVELKLQQEKLIKLLNNICSHWRDTKAVAYNWLSATAFKSGPPSLTDNHSLTGVQDQTARHQEEQQRSSAEGERKQEAQWSSKHDREKEREEISTFSPTMPAATKLIRLSRAASLLLLLVLLLHGRGGLSMGLGMEAMEMDSEVHRRLLWQSTGRRYISYDALRGDAVPCSRPGVPYYNCRITTTANPYTRGCESITRCREAADP